MKRILVFCLMTVVCIGLVACGKDGTETPTGTEAPTPTLTPITEATLTPTQAPTTAPQEDVQQVLDDIADEIRTAYGENYIPNMPYDAISLSEQFGLDASWYDAVVAEGPMISFHVDTLIAVHSTQGNLENVEAALTAYRDKLINDSLQYPANMSKVQASAVETQGDYVFFVMLGVIDDMAYETDEEFLQAWTQQNEIALTVIRSHFN